MSYDRRLRALTWTRVRSVTFIDDLMQLHLLNVGVQWATEQIKTKRDNIDSENKFYFFFIDYFWPMKNV